MGRPKKRKQADSAIAATNEALTFINQKNEAPLVAIAIASAEDDKDKHMMMDDVDDSTLLQNLYGADDSNNPISNNNNNNNNTNKTIISEDSNNNAADDAEADVVVSILDLTSDNSSDANKRHYLSSGYAIHTTSGEYEPIDIYVSDGSESSDDDDDDHDHANIGGQQDKDNSSNPKIEIILTNSRLGVMRRGGLGLTLQNGVATGNKQWVRGSATSSTKDDNLVDNATQLPLRNQEEEEEAERSKEEEDPSIRAARELAEKRRQLEDAKAEARRVESAENAGRDPCLFSKRTAFDIRMDQIEDKPWERGDITDFFNYGMTEYDWAEYAEQQLAVRQELTDASRQKRQPDPNIVPVEPKMPSKQNPKVAVKSKQSKITMTTAKNSNQLEHDNNSRGSVVIGPTVPMVCKVVRDDTNTDHATTTTTTTTTAQHNDGNVKEHEKEEEEEEDDTIGGAWGGAATPGSVLAQLIEEQERVRERETLAELDNPQKQQHNQKPVHSNANVPPPPGGSSNSMEPPPVPKPVFASAQPRFDHRGYGADGNSNNHHTMPPPPLPPPVPPPDISMQFPPPPLPPPPSYHNNGGGRGGSYGGRGGYGGRGRGGYGGGDYHHHHGSGGPPPQPPMYGRGRGGPAGGMMGGRGSMSYNKRSRDDFSSSIGGRGGPPPPRYARGNNDQRYRR
eukprot:CAMPEP_0196826056 /NCGR_PEP_ID=MMETSP1362-20130617/93415_1 /TAXON_ID=163516 /ORGANISM="Leptocylindrus danicus, Strain CCMP1856" /LENGTH=677 /DNA_ID=CAMNT_0042206587 /DNA_START=715 /DNA_END=2748 /DNA_ORIENTATION=-